MTDHYLVERKWNVKDQVARGLCVCDARFTVNTHGFNSPAQAREYGVSRVLALYEEHETQMKALDDLTLEAEVLGLYEETNDG